MKNYFPGQTTQRRSLQAPTTTRGFSAGGTKRGNTGGSLNGKNSFVRSQNLNSKDPKHWTRGNGGQKKILRSPSQTVRNPVARDHNSGNRSAGNRDHGGLGKSGQAFGYSNQGKHGYQNNGWGSYGRYRHGGRNVYLGYPWYGLGGFGAWGGWGYNSGYPLYGSSGYGYAVPYGGGYNTTYLATAQPVVQPAAPAVAVAQNQPAAAATDFVEQGEIDFKAGRYEAAARDWRHALVDDPQNGALVMLMAQAMFALGNYEEAAGATQAAMQMLPEDKWGVVVENYSQLYGNVQAYTAQIKALEKKRDEQPDAAALRFLLGFHFGYLGYPKHAVRELDKGLNLAPADFGARKVRDTFAAKWPDAPPVPAAALAAAKELEKQDQQQPPGGAPGPSDAQPPADSKPASKPPGPSKPPAGTPS